MNIRYVSKFGSAINHNVNHEVLVSCNTSTGQAIALQGSGPKITVPVLPRWNRINYATNLIKKADPLDITEVVDLWYYILATFLEGILTQGQAAFRNFESNCSSISLVYDGISLNMGLTLRVGD